MTVTFYSLKVLFASSKIGEAESYMVQLLNLIFFTTFFLLVKLRKA